MPFIAIHRPTLSRLIELEREARKTGKTWDIAFRHGFVEAMRLLLRSESVGLMLMECDLALEDDDGRQSK